MPSRSLVLKATPRRRLLWPGILATGCQQRSVCLPGRATGGTPPGPLLGQLGRWVKGPEVPWSARAAGCEGEPVDSHRYTTGPPPLSLDRVAGDARSVCELGQHKLAGSSSNGGGGGWGPVPAQTLDELDVELRAMEALLSHGVENDIDWDLRGGACRSLDPAR